MLHMCQIFVQVSENPQCRLLQNILCLLQIFGRTLHSCKSANSKLCIDSRCVIKCNWSKFNPRAKFVSFHPATWQIGNHRALTIAPCDLHMAEVLWHNGSLYCDVLWQDARNFSAWGNLVVDWCYRIGRSTPVWFAPGLKHWLYLLTCTYSFQFPILCKLTHTWQKA